jgi:hypothetical protein
MDYNKLIQRVIRGFFSENKFNSFGKLEWYPPSEKEIKKTFNKSGVKISQQRIKYFKTDEFEINSEANSSDFRQLLISEIEENGIFYCIYDYRTMARMGQKTRYKFKVLNYSDSINISDYQIELLEENMIMIR